MGVGKTVTSVAGLCPVPNQPITEIALYSGDNALVSRRGAPAAVMVALPRSSVGDNGEDDLRSLRPMAAAGSRSNLPGMDCEMVQEKVAVVSAVASETGFDPTAFSRLGVAAARDGVRQSSGTEAGKLLPGNPLLMRTMRPGLARGRGHGAIGIGTRHLYARALTYSARKTPYGKTFEVGTAARSCRAGGCAPSPWADVIVLHS